MHCMIYWFVTFCLASAGLLTHIPKPKIIGGTETTIKKNPWQVSLQSFGLHQCGGVIIGHDVILTAAHCVDTLIARYYEVVAGVTNLEEEGFRVSVKDIILHDEYNGLDYDIAVIRLQEPFNFTETVAPARLPDEEPENGENVKVSGWGVTWDGGDVPTNILREVNLSIVDREKCASMYESHSVITERMVCAGAPGGGRDACQYDSGGPLTKEGTIVGVVSFGEGCGLAAFPGVYTNIYAFNSWIKGKIISKSMWESAFDV